MPYYAVAKGKQSGVYTSWDDCKAQVNGYSGCSFKKFSSLEGAQQFINSNSGSKSKSSSSHSSYSSHSSKSYSSYQPSSYSSNSKVSKPQSSSGHHKSNSSSTKSYSSYPSSSGYSPSSSSPYHSYPSSSGRLKSVTKEKIYVDGACRGNGQNKTPSAGYGVYYGPNDPRNAAVPLSKVDSSNKPTNQRAELHAMVHSLENINKDLTTNKASRPSEIHSDSKYAIECINTWSKRWVQEGWKNSKNQDVANADLIKKAISLRDNIDTKYNEKGWDSLEFTHVRGHSGNEGNERADELANKGADGMEFHSKP